MARIDCGSMQLTARTQNNPACIRIRSANPSPVLSRVSRSRPPGAGGDGTRMARIGSIRINSWDTEQSVNPPNPRHPTFYGLPFAPRDCSSAPRSCRFRPVGTVAGCAAVLRFHCSSMPNNARPVRRGSIYDRPECRRPPALMNLRLPNAGPLPPRRRWRGPSTACPSTEAGRRKALHRIDDGTSMRILEDRHRLHDDRALAMPTAHGTVIRGLSRHQVAGSGRAGPVTLANPAPAVISKHVTLRQSAAAILFAQPGRLHWATSGTSVSTRYH